MRRKVAAVVDALDAIDTADPEGAHSDADELLLDALRAAGRGDVVAAYERVKARSRWWACA
jgi:hypothetical protein